MLKKIVVIVLALLCLVMLIPIPVQATSIIDSGATLPASPVLGQQFIHTPAGRAILYTYDGTAWKAERSYGTMTVYVSTTGTDDLAHGTGTGTSAFRTIQYAWNSIPPQYDSTVTIYVGAGTYTENPVFSGKSGPYASIFIKGTMSQIASLTATGGTRGATSIAPSVTGTFTARANEGKLVHFTSGSNNGQYRVIGYTSTTAIFLDGMSLNTQPASGDTYEILDWATIIPGDSQAYAQSKLYLQFMKMTHTTGMYTFVAWGPATMWLEQCWIFNNGPSFGLWASGAGTSVMANNCYFTGGAYQMECDNNAQLEINGCKCAGTLVGIRAINGGAITGVLGCEISGSTCGIQLFGNSTMELSQGNNYSYIHGCTYPLNVNTGAGIMKHSSLVEGKQINNITADANTTSDTITAATFGWAEN